jgi:hypothetical protein
LFDGAVPQPPRPYLARNRFRWTKFAQSARLLGIVQRGRRRIAELAFLDHGYPVWYQLEMDLATGRALRARRLTPENRIRHAYDGLDRRLRIEPPPG